LSDHPRVEWQEQRLYLGYLSAVLYLVSFGIPWFSFSPNRILPAENFSFGALAAVSPGVLGLPLGALIAVILQGTPYRWRGQKIGIYLAGLLSSLGVFWALALYGENISELVAKVVPSGGRLGLTGGWFLFLLAGLIQIIGESRPKGGVIVLSLGFLGGIFLVHNLGVLTQLGVVQEALQQKSRLLVETVHHFQITGISVTISILLGIPSAIIAFTSAKGRKVLFALFNILQTIPSIALFGLMITPLAFLSRNFPVLREMGIRGIGNAPAIIALSIYGLYPVMRNTFTAMTMAEGPVIDAARGMGMTNLQQWLMVRIPLATPLILGGIKIAVIQTMGNAVLAKLIGGNGLGVFVFQGLGQASVDMVLLGMGLIILATLVTDGLFRSLITLATPKALRLQYGMEKQDE